MVSSKRGDYSVNAVNGREFLELTKETGFQKGEGVETFILGSHGDEQPIADWIVKTPAVDSGVNSEKKLESRLNRPRG